MDFISSLHKNNICCTCNNKSTEKSLSNHFKNEQNIKKYVTYSYYFKAIEIV